jgi:type IV pilus assembly protein PilC
MPSFVWKGRTAPAPSGGRAARRLARRGAASLRRQNIQVTSIREKGREVRLIPRLPRKISQKRVAIFTRQFSVMLDAGLPLVQCLEILGEQEEDKGFAEIINLRASTSRAAPRWPRRCASIRAPSTSSSPA